MSGVCVCVCEKREKLMRSEKDQTNRHHFFLLNFCVCKGLGVGYLFKWGRHRLNGKLKRVFH